MAIHLCRDYQNQTFFNQNWDLIPYMTAIFLHKILGYTVVGQTNFDINSATFLKASGTTTPNRAGINFGAGFTFEVSIPVAVRTVSVSDVGRILFLKSTANPLFNSGPFLITGFNAASNRYIIDYRAIGAPPAEAADSIQWWLYERDNTIPQNRTTPNAGPGYRSFGAACTCSRIILQSQHATGWQVRICLEHALDFASGFVVGSTDTCNIVTYTTGFDGTAIGDFLVGGEHNHGAQWWNSTDKNVCGQTPGSSSGGASLSLTAQEQFRITMIGDEEGHGLYCVARRPFGPVPSGLPCHAQFQFGLCENEPSPIPVKPARRVFTMGNNSITNNNQVFVGVWANSTHYHGITQGFNGQPVMCNLASWSYIETNTGTTIASNGAPFFNVNGGDNPFTGATDLLPVDVVAGMGENWYNQQNNRVYQFEPRVMGTLPFVRVGRASTAFSTTTDVNNSWQHVDKGLYIQWGGPAVLP